MPACLELGGVTTEMAIEDLNETLTALVVGLLAQGLTNQEIIQNVKQAVDINNEELKLLNARTEEVYETTITKEDIEQ